MRIAYLLLISIFMLLICLSLIVIILGKSISAPGYKGEAGNHFNGTTFFNSGDVESKSFFDVLKWYYTREKGEWNEVPEEEIVYHKPDEKVNDGIRITYVNHSTFLIQTQGLNILTDPVWSYRVSPFSFTGPRRFRPPGIKFKDLPAIDLIMISHNHYDHLDIETLRSIHEKDQPLVITPLGIPLYLQEEGITNTAGLDWWQSSVISDSLIIHSVPAQHFSGRGLFDRDQTLWSGYIIESGDARIYFAGDTGYGELFKEIGERFAPIDLSLIPIGAYKPRWFMKPMHVNPDEALQVHRDVGSLKSLGMHFGTFPLADDAMNDPIRDLRIALSDTSAVSPDFSIIEEGTSVSFK